MQIILLRVFNTDFIPLVIMNGMACSQNFNGNDRLKLKQKNILFSISPIELGWIACHTIG